MNSFYSLAGSTGLSALISGFASNATKDLLGVGGNVSADVQSLITSGVGTLAQSALSGQFGSCRMLTSLAQRENIPGMRNHTTQQPRTAPQRTTNHRSGGYQQTETQLFAALLTALKRGQRNT